MLYRDNYIKRHERDPLWWSDRRSAHFHLQLPYANHENKEDGRCPATVVSISSHDAEMLDKLGTHMIIGAGKTNYVVTPLVPAEHLVFQIGDPAL